MDEPDIRIAYYGGQTTAPIFKKLAEQIASYYHIKPDREITPPETLAGAGQGNLNTAAVRQN